MGEQVFICLNGLPFKVINNNYDITAAGTWGVNILVYKLQTEHIAAV